MPKNATVYLIRHAEKPDKCEKPADSRNLSYEGKLRVAAYTAYFRYGPDCLNPAQLSHLFASTDSPDSCRPRLTIEPLAVSLGLTINLDHDARDYEALAKAILTDPTYDNTAILICWHHQQILHLAKALGAHRGVLPSEACWPEKEWPDGVFGWLLRLVYGPDGSLIPAQTSCTNQQLMYWDYAMNPPGAT